MSELLTAVKNLREFTFRPPSQIGSFSMSAIEKLRAELEKNSDRSLSISPVEKDALLRKWIGGDRNFLRREIKKLPFIMFDARLELDDMTEMLRLLNLSRETQLKNIIAVYLLNFDGSDKSHLLRQTIFERMSAREYRSKMLNRIYRDDGAIFTGDCFECMSALYKNCSGIDEALSAIGLTDFFKGSNFIRRSLKHFLCSTTIDIRRRLEILYEIDAEPNNIFDGVIRSSTDAVIPDVEAIDNPSDKADAKKHCLEIFYRELGDPRFGSLTYKWDNVSSKAREIFLHWLAENDLDLFFKIIDRAAVDRMWRHRKKFWKAYLPYITNTWVFLGKEAQHFAKQAGDKILHHGNLFGGGSNQSVLLFQIGKYVFVEWSHNGKLRAYYYDDVKNWFGAEDIRRIRIMSSFIVEDWIHANPLSGTWQRKVSWWLEKNCGIDSEIWWREKRH